MTGQDLNLELIIKARADQARAEIAATNASIKGMQAEAAAATTVSAAQMSAALKKVGGDLSKITPEMLGMGTAAVAAGDVATAATQKLSKSINEVSRVSPIAMNEFRALFDEVSSGRTYRSPGTIAILAQKVFGLSTAALVAGGAVLVLGAGVGYLVYESLEAQKQLDQLTEAFKLTGRSAQFTSQWISYERDLLGSLHGVTSEATSGFQQFVAQHAEIGPVLENEVGQLLPAFVDLYGKEAPQAAGKLALALSDLTQSGFKKLNNELLNLNPQEYETIRHLIEIGDTAQATKRILDDLSHQSGVYIKSLGDQVYDQLQKIKSLKEQINSPLFAAADEGGAARAALLKELADAEQKLAAIRAQEKNQGKAGADQAYSREIQSIDQINQKTDERTRLEKQLAEAEKARADAAGRGDTNNVQSADQAIATTKAKLTALNKHDTEESYSNFEAAENAKAAAFKTGSAARIAVLSAEVAKAKALFGTESTQYEQAMGRLVAARRQASDQEVQAQKHAVEQAKQNLNREIQDANTALRQKLSGELTIAQQRVQLGQITSQQEIAEEKALEQQLYETELQGLQKRLKLEQLTPAEKMRIDRQIEQLEQQHQNRMTQLSNKAALDLQKSWEHALQPIGQAFDQSIKGMIQGTQSFQQAIGSILDSVLAEYVDMGVKALLHHLAMEAAKTAATATAAETRTAVETAAKTQSLMMSAEIALKQILNDAWQAASAAFKATAAIPVIGPVLAPAAGAAAFTAVAAMGGNIASAAGGYWELPGDQMIFAHEKEMVLPARFADGLRGMIEGGRGGAQGPSHTTIQAVDAASFTRLMKRNPGAVAAGLKSVRRNGSLR